MKEEDSIKMIDYLDGRLEGDERTAFEQRLANNVQLRKEWEALHDLNGLMRAFPEEEPSSALGAGFLKVLQNKKSNLAQRPKSPGYFMWTLEWRIAAAVALLVIGIGFGMLWQRNQQQQVQIGQLAAEVANTRKMLVLSMLQQNSASERIQAIQTSAETVLADPKIVQALIHTLQHDENVNVRMKAVEALRVFVHEEGVVDALVEVLTTDQSPEVQINLIEALVEIGARQAIPSLENLVREDAVIPVVKGKAVEGLSKLL